MEAIKVETGTHIHFLATFSLPSLSSLLKVAEHSFAGGQR